MDVRELTAEDDDAAYELGRLAFGGPRTPPGPRPNVRPGRRAWGAFDDAGRMTAKAVDLEHAYWYDGRPVPGTGIAGVAVAAESRGSGLPGRVIGALLAAARERGAAVSALFPTTVVPYRRLGWEVAGSLTWWSVPAADLAHAPVPAGTTLRAATEADVPAVIGAYRATAREGAGLLDRSGPLFASEPAEVLAAFDGVTVAEGPGGLEGYASWERGPGYDESSRAGPGWARAALRRRRRTRRAAPHRAAHGRLRRRRVPRRRLGRAATGPAGLLLTAGA